ncbi:MAG: MmgE/PrpD family protein [Alsobacter sp.]
MAKRGHSILAVAKLHLLDALGVGLAAASVKAGRPWLTAASSVAGNGSCSVLGTGRTGSPEGAALVNGGLIHSLEYDDTHTGSIVHGSALLAPVALAAAQDAGRSGADLLGAFIRGWEAFIRIGLASPGGFQAQGFQVTSVGGALVGALVAAELYGLSEDETVHALGIALSQASGVFEFLTNGSSVKSMHPGWAAHAGIMAAKLARAGLQGPETALEGKLGLFRRFAADTDAAARLDAQLADLGSVWRLREAAFKLYPCCHYLHPFVEAGARLRADGIDPGVIVDVLCRIAAGAAPIVCEPWSGKQAAQGHAARWSLPVAVAGGLVLGGVDLDTFERPLPDTTRALATRVRWEPLPDACFPDRFEAELAVTLADGTVHAVRIDDVYGNAGRPAAEADVRAKFRANAGRLLDADSVAALEGAGARIDATGLDPLAMALARAGHTT